MNQELFLRRRSKAHVPMGTGGATRAQVASAVREVAAFRCVLSEPLIEQIGMLSATELKHWLSEIVGVLRRKNGAHVHHRPFYPDFPEQVLAASEAELYLNAVIHYLTRWRLSAMSSRLSTHSPNSRTAIFQNASLAGWPAPTRRRVKYSSRAPYSTVSISHPTQESVCHS